MDAGQEIRESFDIEFTANTIHQGWIGPLLTWDTFDQATGTLADSPLIGFIGDLNVPHAVTGSPCSTNFLRVSAVGLDGVTPIDLDGAGGNEVTETLFAVTGRVFDGTLPAPLTVSRSSYGRDVNGRVSVFVNSAPTATLTVEGEANLPVGAQPLTGDGAGNFFGNLLLGDASVLPATVTVTADNPGNGITTHIRPFSDEVNITTAEYDTTTSTLRIGATSSDRQAPPLLNAFAIGNLPDAAGECCQPA